MERKKGFLQMDHYELIRNCNHETDGKYCVAWIKKQEIEYLLKQYENYKTCYKEVFWSYVLTELGKITVGYDLVSYNGQVGVITKNANPNHYPVKSLKELIYHFRECSSLEYRHSTTFELYNVLGLFKVFEFNYGPNVSKILNQELLELFIIQILSGNCDLHGKNVAIIERPEITFFPYFDFGGYNLANFQRFTNNEFILKYKKGIFLESQRQTLQNFLTFANKKEIELLKEYIEKFQTLKVNNIFEKMETNIENRIPRNLKKDLARKLVHNSNIVEKQIKLHQR
ncbi:MAG: type II toxin-antitoxin system HipA family toxin [Bacilli bacterium]|nr:type II toxin-antitoxin system HipA family toxin [Bacilli bacterium]